MNARYDDDFQLRMLEAAVGRMRWWCSTAVVARQAVAYGGFDLSDRNLRVLGWPVPRAGPAAAARTGNVCSSRMVLGTPGRL
jgi:hypothetical protein